ncbi:MAG: hypothetical protein KH353_12960, partial [Clostridium sp.]|nr:hypothetical protein [Clostridium sp.]
YGEFCVVTLFYQTAIDHVYFYKIEFAKLIIRYPYIFVYIYICFVKIASFPVFKTGKAQLFP